MRLFKIFFAIVLLIALLPAQGKSAEYQLKAVTSIFAPLQMKQGDRLKGYTVEIVQEVFKEMRASGLDIHTSIRSLPWKRAMRQAESEPNTIFFSLSRTPQREEKFEWLAEISPYQVYLFKLKSNKLPEVTSLLDIKKLDIKVAVQIASNMVPVLENSGFIEGQDYITYQHYTNGIPMLFHGRFDLMPLTGFVARTNTCKLGLNGDEIEPYLPVDAISKPLWVVMSKGSSPVLIEAFKNHFIHLQETGFVKATQERYLADWAQQPC
ncbi:MAG: ABC transporter substrate-binding protein [Alphaproteobacteria bacterium]|nr:ABC transporter substrate-binding protein [Alphaproteobacteria bacterium]